ncbi:type II toxin-antitoxin system RelE/ParE family toxin [Novosphingobium sp. ST904]|uniref:type II toxin-antitoxin system RelE/ParE family toxin n=1 Tax=Novosphingobium sp. ST904 TaxID=1684385 RepID=UPI0006C8D016|nr:type II toxin-antitoxin system RelE/ParE family toxin [Novosphingobium sp. ST904]KPH66667.1 plasmid stabilization protein [Novosphingobium sp. ST904]TCM26174.1 toxin ParE1/3/4 [Novosphingobium sp. ST904]
MPDAVYAVELTQAAEDDLEEIHGYIAKVRGADDADALIDQFLAVVDTLESCPERGGVPKELEGLGLREFRQVLLRQFRLIYRVIGERVVILLVADGRRDMRELLERRLLGRPH